METIQSQLGPAIDSEREINNAVNYKLKRRHLTPDWVAKGKLAHIDRLVKDGTSLIEAARLAHVALNTVRRWRKLHGVLTQDLRAGTQPQKGKTMKRKKMTNTERARAGARARWAKVRASKAIGTKRRTFTFDQRMEFVHKANELMASKTAVNMGHAAAILGVGAGVLSTWRKLAARKQRFYKHKNHTPRVKRDLSGTNGLTVSINEAINVLRELVLSQGAPKPNVDTMCLMYENWLLKKRISR